MTDIANTIILLGGIATAVIAIITLTVKLVRVFKAIVEFITSLKTQVDTLVEHDNSQYLSILRLTIVNDSMPMSERLLAGKKYVERGGNGDIKRLYNNLKEQCNSSVSHDHCVHCDTHHHQE